MARDTDLIDFLERLLELLKPKKKKYEMRIYVGPVEQIPPDRTIEIYVGPVSLIPRSARRK